MTGECNDPAGHLDAFRTRVESAPSCTAMGDRRGHGQRVTTPAKRRGWRSGESASGLDGDGQQLIDERRGDVSRDRQTEH